MRKIFIGATLLAGMSAFAQETYENANIATEDVNGTARYVGMGGAMEALGADISTIGTNPAGVGMFRRSQVAMTAGVTSVSGFMDTTTKMGFDQAGGVWSMPMGNGKFLNIGFNYHRSRDFNQTLDVRHSLDGASQNKLTGAKGYEGVFDSDNCYNQADYLYENVLGLYDKAANEWSFFDAKGYDMYKVTSGYTGAYDICMAGNVSTGLYLGLTVGLKDVHYNAFTTYTEDLVLNGKGIGSVTMNDSRIITGSGVDVKFGAILFPVQGSAFRIGASIATPTFYDLTTSNVTSLQNNLDRQYGAYDKGQNNETYDYRIFTPWKFGLSMGHTVGGCLALGASYEYADYGATKSRVIDGYDYYGDASSYDDQVMNRHTQESLKGVHTLKLGAEYKATPELALRAGYNFVSAMYDKDAFRNGALDSPGTYYSSTTDYTNWKDTERISFGLGYAKGHWAFDMAYQYSTTKGEFYPFMAYYGETAAEDCVPDAVSVDNNRHRFMATLTYKF